ncbi:hypothetical protein HN51_061080 [Arachis hypogaea]
MEERSLEKTRQPSKRAVREEVMAEQLNGDEDANPVDRVFGGKIVNKEPLTDLSLEIEDVETIERALDSFTRVEMIDDQKVKCDKCGEQVFKEKQLLFNETPQHRVFHLKRLTRNKQITLRERLINMSITNLT